MGLNSKKISQGIKELSGFGKFEIEQGEVVKVDVARNTIDVETDKDVVRFDVSLRVLHNKDTGLILVPKKGSSVVIAQIEGGQDYCLLQASELDKEIIKGGKFKVENNGEDLKGLIGELIDAITQITVPTAVGPSGIPVNIAVFTAIKQRLNQILE